ncbi:MarR family winged helix-turn-helix transcriptional regulator [Macrococcoides caseolyticum]|uniref:MarR family winged helix-turn-helix transcriptional regulator n=1 Tax=Macrococcoides caseolyticum TaxID=69966 RepID=UPI001F1FFB2C|nr:MarR family transcriptional regulator [Macrococcus caseolyticus]MCE4957280.1 MarR family transcriptional regulator [Macrococcus caseolyticus]
MQTNRSYLVWLNTARIYNDVLKQSNDQLKRSGMSTSHFDCMNQIDLHPGCTQNELSELMFVTKGNITHLLKKLETEGLIERSQEWKEKHIRLTSKGKALLENLRPKQITLQESIFGSLSQDEQKQLLKLLRKIKNKG